MNTQARPRSLVVERTSGFVPWIRALIVTAGLISGMTLTRRCLYCNSTYVRRSRRRGALELLILPWFFLRPFRCRDCYRRSYLFLFAKRVHVDSRQDKGGEISMGLAASKPRAGSSGGA